MTREEALKQIREWDIIIPQEMEVLQTLIPELRESDEERIRKKLIQFLKYYHTGNGDKVEYDDAFISYLEKQKEQPIPLMNGDADAYFDEWLHQFFGNPTRRQCYEEGMRYAERLQKEQKPPVFTDWNEEDQTLLSDALGCVTMVQELKKRGELKNFCIPCTPDELKSWIRSLKSRPRKQPHWKPSEELLEALHTAAYLPEMEFYGGLKDKLRELNEQLKKQI